MNWKYLIAPIAAWTIAQVTKVVYMSARQRRLNLRVLAEMGGMPSSHSALVMGLTTAIGRLDGLGSPAFAIALIFSLVVMYDAAGVRRAAGRVCADIGDSTGGFTDVLLQRGAARVYAVEVGRGLIHWRLRQDPRVVLLERTNARELSGFPEPVSLVTVDVSFIGLEK